MASFIHLTDERLLARLGKSGIRTTFRGRDRLRGVYATPVLPDFQISHQWIRELKGRGIRTIGALQFRIPDEEEVLVGRYSEAGVAVTAAEAVKIFMDHPTGLGLEVLIRRRIEAKEITRTYLPPQMLGWRYFPAAHGKPPACGCDFCQRGLIKNRKLRETYAAENPAVEAPAIDTIYLPPADPISRRKPKLEIRPAWDKESEADALSDIRVRSKGHWGYSRETLEAWRPAMRITREYIRQNLVRSLVLDGRLVGFYAFKMDEDVLDHLWLIPAAIGLGVGKAAFEHAVRLAQELRMKSFLIVSDPDAEGFYLKLGAQKIGELFSPHQNRMLPKLLFSVPQPAVEPEPRPGPAALWPPASE